MMNASDDNARSELSALGWLFFIMTLLQVLASLGFGLVDEKGITIPIEVTLVASEFTILIPAVIYIIAKNIDLKSELGFRRIKAGTVLMCLLLAALIEPVASFVNVLSQLFVSNTMAQMSDELLGGSGITVLFLASIYGPVCEEIVFRSLFNNRYEKYTGPLAAGLISAMFFGLAHLNINQATYAFVLGVIFSVINKAAGSVLPSMIIHICINAFNMIMMFAMTDATGELAGGMDLEQAAEMARTGDMMYILIAVTLIMSVISIAIAIPCVVWIAKHEGNIEALHDMFAVKHKKYNWLRVSTVIGICFALFVMFGLKSVLEMLNG